MIGERVGVDADGRPVTEGGSGGGTAGDDAPTAGRENTGERANGLGPPGAIAGRVAGGIIGGIPLRPGPPGPGAFGPGAFGPGGDAVPDGGTIGRAE